MAAIGRGVGELSRPSATRGHGGRVGCNQFRGDRDGTENPMSFTTTGAIVGQSPYREQIVALPAGPDAPIRAVGTCGFLRPSAGPLQEGVRSRL